MEGAEQEEEEEVEQEEEQAEQEEEQAEDGAEEEEEGAAEEEEGQNEEDAEVGEDEAIMMGDDEAAFLEGEQIEDVVGEVDEMGDFDQPSGIGESRHVQLCEVCLHSPPVGLVFDQKKQSCRCTSWPQGKMCKYMSVSDVACSAMAAFINKTQDRCVLFGHGLFG